MNKTAGKQNHKKGEKTARESITADGKFNQILFRFLHLQSGQ